MTYIVSVGIVNAAVRNEKSVMRQNISTAVSRTTSSPRTSKTATVTSRAPAKTSSRRPSARTSMPTRAASSTSISRAATSNIRTTKSNTSRSAGISSRPTRAASTPIQSNTFGTGYNACRDAYFTCMDQFCATQNETYRRCACSSRLAQIQSRESLLSDTANQLQDFKDFNLSVIDKSASEVSAMISASDGEALASTKQDTSKSNQQLTNIGAILAQAKSNSLSTAGTLDIGGDIKQIWKTTDLADGANIANLTGESLYNAVHAQCSQMVSDTCGSKSTLNMVVSAYGMYIENDCTTLSNNLDSKTNAAKGTVRDTEREMHTARLENYNTHNTTSINDCIANVRADITANTACGPDYVHCLDVTGRYLNRDTGAPIYSANFYQLDGQVSLSGNILTNQTNRLIVAELNRMRIFAEQSLDTCRDIADDVWDEFIRQAITEIYQGQQSVIRTVKNNCLDVVNACYDEQNQSLKDFSNIKEQLLLGQRLELSEELCREKLDACSNLYGGGPDGFAALINAMHNLTDSKIAKSCRATLQDYARDICTVPNNDTLHGYPYACRVYAPGEQKYAQNNKCNQILWSNNSGSSASSTTGSSSSTNTYICTDLRRYTSCKPGYYMTTKNYESDEDVYNPNPTPGNACTPCPPGYTCPGGTNDKISAEDQQSECNDYPGSLYQRLVRYALQSCVRPSNTNDPDYVISAEVLADVNAVMDSIRVDMGTSLATECERWGGVWVDTRWKDDIKNKYCCTEDKCLTGDGNDGNDGCHDITGDTLFKTFYDETGANTAWGYCRPPKTTDTTIPEAERVPSINNPGEASDESGAE